ncbi:MAG: DUF1273 family protein [Clostridia bacterium]|nr:DUF1273 family protein [Clostridia bacterium]
MQTKACCFTGHRVLPAGREEEIRRRLVALVQARVAEGYGAFYDGGAQGFDLLAGETLLALRQSGAPVQLRMALPCRDQAADWPAWQQRRYQALLEAADEVIFLADAYTPGCMQQRDRYMVEHSDACIAYLIHRGGGTAYTVRCARRKGCPVYLLYPELEPPEEPEDPGQCRLQDYL